MMYYIEDQDPILVKNEVTLDKMRLRELQSEITLRFGEYVHKSYDGEKKPYSAEDMSKEKMKIIRNYSEEPKGEVLHFEYDEFLAPELSKLIMCLLDGDASAIELGEALHGLF